MRNFRNLNIWKESMDLAKDVYQLSFLLPNDEKYLLKNQICRAAVSIPSNIAEGCSGESEISFKRYLNIAIGSSFELETQLILIQNMDIINDDVLVNPLARLKKIQKMINSLIKLLKKTANSQLLIANSK